MVYDRLPRVAQLAVMLGRTSSRSWRYPMPFTQAI
jgi:hypothetical protein